MIDSRSIYFLIVGTLITITLSIIIGYMYQFWLIVVVLALFLSVLGLTFYYNNKKSEKLL